MFQGGVRGGGVRGLPAAQAARGERCWLPAVCQDPLPVQAQYTPNPSTTRVLFRLPIFLWTVATIRVWLRWNGEEALVD